MRSFAGGAKLSLYGGAGSAEAQTAPLVTNSSVRPNRVSNRSFRGLLPPGRPLFRVIPGLPRARIYNSTATYLKACIGEILRLGIQGWQTNTRSLKKSQPA